MVFTAFPSERDSHGAVLDEQRQRIEVQRSPVERATCALNVITMAEAADKHPVLERSEMERHVASGTMVPISIKLAVMFADD